jgi:Ca-activated chloride channel family protein
MWQIRTTHILQQSCGEPQDKGGWCWGILLAAGLVTLSTPALGCEIALALAIDVSGSVDINEYDLQLIGLADALRDGAVADALVRAQAQVMLVQWTGNERQIMAVPWTKLTSYQDAVGFADRVAASPRAWRNFSTAIGEALSFTKAQFGAAQDCTRRVIDLSGDGFSNEGVEPRSLRQQFRIEGFTVNGLAIEGSDEDLTGYYRENVITGAGAFVVTANGFTDYAKRIKLKLLREVAPQVSMREDGSAEAIGQDGITHKKVMMDPRTRVGFGSSGGDKNRREVIVARVGGARSGG